jgi:hypothetical protein
LPDGAKTDVANARAALNAAVRMFLWSLLAFLLTTWGVWLGVIAAAAAYLSYREMLNTARIYGKLLEATFDVHRKALYESLRWPLPATPAEDVIAGAAITRYLWRGTPRRDAPVFTGATVSGSSVVKKAPKPTARADGQARSL